jgi:hypothetical protein
MPKSAGAVIEERFEGGDHPPVAFAAIHLKWVLYYWQARIDWSFERRLGRKRGKRRTLP